MANQFAMLASGGNFSFNASTTYFNQLNAPQVISGVPTETPAQVKFRGACTLSNLYVNVSTASSSATTVDIRQNGASAALTVSCTGAGTGSFSDLTHSVTVADGDLICYRVAVGTGGGFVANVSCQLTTAGQVYTSLVGANTQGSNSVPANGNFYSVAGNLGPANTTELASGIVALESATLSNLQLYIAINSQTGAHTLISRKNEANGAQTVTVTASTLGLYEDATNSDTLASGDRFDAMTT